MRYLICAFEMTGCREVSNAPYTVNLGISAEVTERIIPLSRVQNSLYETEENDVFISIPALFRHYHATPHGLLLKRSVSPACFTRKITLLTPKIEKDLEIPEENVHSLPDVFSGPFVFFKGVFFGTNEKTPVFIVNPEKLTECIK